MHQESAVECDLAERTLPDEDEPNAAHFDYAQRDQAERMIEQMRRDIEEKDVARPEANTSDHGATSEAAAPLRAAGRSRRGSRRRRPAVAAGSDGRRSRRPR